MQIVVYPSILYPSIVAPSVIGTLFWTIKSEKLFSHNQIIDLLRLLVTQEKSPFNSTVCRHIVLFY